MGTNGGTKTRNYRGGNHWAVKQTPVGYIIQKSKYQQEQTQVVLGRYKSVGRDK